MRQTHGFFVLSAIHFTPLPNPKDFKMALSVAVFLLSLNALLESIRQINFSRASHGQKWIKMPTFLHGLGVIAALDVSLT